MLYRDFYPFYAAQGNPVFYNEEREQEREFDLMKSYYPDTARKIQEKAEMQCQLLDYEGSRLYDEYPDRLSLLRKSQEVWEQAQKRENFGENSPDWEQIRDLIGVLLLQEMLVRRKKKRRR